MQQSISKQADISALGRYNTTVYKGVAILSVMLCHFMGRFGHGITWFTPLGGIGVAVFLVLSGYGLTVSWEKTGHKAWWRKRLLSTFLPYFLIQIVAYWPFHGFSVQSFLLDITLISPQYSNGWYLTYLLMWYIAFYLVMRFSVIRKFMFPIFAVLSLVSFFAFAKTYPLRAEQSFSFFAGVLFAKLNQEKISKIFRLRYGILSLFAGITFLGIKQLPLIRNSGEYIYNLVELFIKLPCAIGLMIVLYCLLKHVHLRAIYWVGIVSYELYIVHGYVLEQVPVTWWGGLLFVFITAVASTLIWLLLDKTKRYQKRLLRI